MKRFLLMVMLLLSFSTKSVAHGDDICIEDEGKRFTARYESLGNSLSVYDRGRERDVFVGHVNVRTRFNESGEILRIFKSEFVYGRINLVTGTAFFSIKDGKNTVELFDLSVRNTPCAQ